MCVVRIASRELISDNARGVAGDARQPDLHQGDEIPIDRCPIPGTFLAEERDHLGVREWPIGFGQDTQDGQAGSGHAQSELAKPFLDFSNRGLHDTKNSRFRWPARALEASSENSRQGGHRRTSRPRAWRRTLPEQGGPLPVVASAVELHQSR